MALSVNPLSRRSFWKWTTTLILGLALLTWALQSWKPWLNANERRLIGIWTWQDGPGEMTLHFHEDGTVHHRMSDGKTRVLIPWDSDVAESLKHYVK